MRRWDFVGGIFVRVGRWWLGLVAAWPILVRVPVIAGGADVTDEFYASEGVIGYGAQFLVGQGDSPESFVAVPEVMKISPIVSMTTPTIKTTHLRSPDRHEEKIATISDSAAIVVTGTFRPSHGAHKLAGGDGFDATHNLQALRASAARNNYQIMLPASLDSEALPLEGVVTKYEIGELGNDGLIPFTLEITPTRSYFSR